jgi:NTP pyrophosphatase (non-canonical NTP hydrolase)
MSVEIEKLTQLLRDFAQARDWEQFHSAKNLSMAITIEAAELSEHFLWLTEQQSQQLAAEKKQEVAFEMADIFLYLLRLADRLDINLIEAAHAKMIINDQRYPPEQARGRADKYTAYNKE